MESIVIPFWLFIIIIVFATVMVLDRILLPSMRWLIKRRVNRVISELNQRLDIEIRPIQYTRRQSNIDQLVFDEKVISSIKACAKKNNMPYEVAQEKAREYATEIIPAFNAYIYFKLGYWLSKKLARLFYRVRVGFHDNDKITQRDKESSVVFVMNHRSNMDYMLVSFLVADKTILSYAVGEWAKVWPLRTLMKSMGAFFVRRNTSNKLYRKVLERYVNTATRAGVCQAVFLEGGLTKTGSLQKPRLGFLDYMLREYRPQVDRDIIFIPVGINYDRVVEDRSMQRRLIKNAKKRSAWFIFKTSARFTIKNILLTRKKRWRRFGYASVHFGEPISAKAYCETNQLNFSSIEKKDRFNEVKTFAEFIMENISKVIPILPIALLCEVMLANKKNWLSETEIATICTQRLKILKKNNAPIYISLSAIENIISASISVLVGRSLVLKNNDLYQIDHNEVSILKYYANSISHWQ